MASKIDTVLNQYHKQFEEEWTRDHELTPPEKKALELFKIAARYSAGEIRPSQKSMFGVVGDYVWSWVDSAKGTARRPIDVEMIERFYRVCGPILQKKDIISVPFALMPTDEAAETLFCTLTREKNSFIMTYMERGGVIRNVKEFERRYGQIFDAMSDAGVRHAIGCFVTICTTMIKNGANWEPRCSGEKRRYFEYCTFWMLHRRCGIHAPFPSFSVSTDPKAVFLNTSDQFGVKEAENAISFLWTKEERESDVPAVKVGLLNLEHTIYKWTTLQLNSHSTLSPPPEYISYKNTYSLE